MMGFINQTLFPEKKVSLLAVDARLESNMKHNLRVRGLELLEIPSNNGLQNPVSGHPDMQMLHIRDDILVCQPQMPETLMERLLKIGFSLHPGVTQLKPAYPFDIAYNVAIIGKVAFHNTKHTDPVAKELLEKCSIQLLHVNQGYTKCSILPVTPESFITADLSIARVASGNGFDVLLLPPQTNIRLKSLNYGFIGGTAGFINKNLLAFSGKLEALNDAETVKAFLMKHGVQWVDLGKEGIQDYGGLIPLYE